MYGTNQPVAFDRIVEFTKLQIQEFSRPIIISLPLSDKIDKSKQVCSMLVENKSEWSKIQCESE